MDMDIPLQNHHSRGKLIKMIDVHTHIIPFMDDGAKTVSEATEMLEKESKDGVTTIIATPHFYLEQETIENFIERRNNNLREFKKNLSCKEEVKILLGAEVLFTPSLAECDLSPLFIENTRYILIEPPYQEFTKTFQNSFRSFLNSIDGVPIIAHLERYLKWNSIDTLCEFMDSIEVLGQANCNSFLKIGRERKLLFELVKNHYIHLLATDTHNMSNRPPCLLEAKKVIDKRLPENTFDFFMYNAKRVIDNQKI